MLKKIHLRTSGFGRWDGAERESSGAYCFFRRKGRTVTITDDPAKVTCRHCLAKLAKASGRSTD